jgi:hypothetical protein
MALAKKDNGDIAVEISGYDLETPAKDFIGLIRVDIEDFIKDKISTSKNNILATRLDELMKPLLDRVEDDVSLKEYIAANSDGFLKKIDEALDHSKKIFADDKDNRQIIEHTLNSMKLSVNEVLGKEPEPPVVSEEDSRAAFSRLVLNDNKSSRAAISSDGGTQTAPPVNAEKAVLRSSESDLNATSDNSLRRSLLSGYSSGLLNR